MPVDARAIDGSTAVMIAAASGHLEMSRLLIERAANVNLADEHGDTAFMAAVRAGSLDSAYQRGVKYLLETQEPDGSWLVHKRAVPINEYFESGFPHGKFQFISYPGTWLGDDGAQLRCEISHVGPSGRERYRVHGNARRE